MAMVKRDDFDKIKSMDAKLGILFETQIETLDTLNSNVEAINKRFEAGNARFKKLENRKKTDTAVSAGGGIFGGFLAMILKTAFWK